MLIVSKWHDYYDTISAYGIDKTCVYNRSEEFFEVEYSHWNSPKFVILPNGKRREFSRVPSSQYTGRTDGAHRLHKRVIGFCGQLYPMIVAEYWSNSVLVRESFLYTVEETLKYMEREGLNTERSKYWYVSSFDIRSEKGIANHFDKSQISNMDDIFHSFRTPIFVLGSGFSGADSQQSYLAVNPCLKKLGFMKVKDPQTAFQEVYMYLSGVLGAPPKPTKPIDDKTMAASKGHDSPYSFRKPPGKRGKNRWR